MGIRIRQELHVVVAPFRFCQKGSAQVAAQQASTKLETYQP